MMMTPFDLADPLAAALSAAIDSVEARTEFYRQLLTARVYVLATRDMSGRLVPIACESENGSSYVPFFSALTLLRAAVAPSQLHTLLHFRELLTLMPQHLLWLNPLSSNNKQFFPAETAFLSSKGVASAVIYEESGEQAQLLMAHVAPEVQKQARQLLSAHLRAEEGVREAWLIQTYRPDLDDPPRLLLGIQGDCLPSELLVWARSELEQKLPGTPVVDIIVCAPDNAICDYMKNEAEHVFTRSWMDRLFG